MQDRTGGQTAFESFFFVLFFFEKDMLSEGSSILHNNTQG